MFYSFLNYLVYHTPIFYLIQSVWRDEAFSYFMAKPSITQIIINTANDFNPPLYYLLLHFWMYLVGQSDILLRLLSFFFHMLGVYFAYLLGRKLSRRLRDPAEADLRGPAEVVAETGINDKFALILAMFYLFNPMLLYYSFEIRMYSLYALTATAAVYYFYIKNWKWFVVWSVLGLYSHSFFVLIIFSFAAYLFWKERSKKNLFKTILPLLFFLPWIPIIINQFIRSKGSWLFPVDWQLIKSVLGNLFTGYEGTPGGLWKYTALVSLLILFTVVPSLANKKLKTEILYLPIILPLSIILLFSVIKRPVYVNRYMMFVPVFEVIAIMAGLNSIKNKYWRNLYLSLWIFIVVFFNIYPVPYRKKTDFKTTFSEINRMARPEDYVYAKTPIGFLESAYYYKNPDKVFVYNPNKIVIPNYIGVNVVFPNISRQSLPPAPSRTFLVNDDASFELIITQ